MKSLATLTLPIGLGLLIACGEGGNAASAPAPVLTPPDIEVGHIDTIVGSGARATDPVDGDADGKVDPPILALQAMIDTPMDTYPALDGTLYVIDWNGHKIRSLDRKGKLHFVVGTGIEGDACEGDVQDAKCPAEFAEINHPTDVCVDQHDQLWIAAWHNSKIKRVDLKTSLLENVCGIGNRTLAGDGGQCHDTDGKDLVSFDLPSGICVDALGNVFVSDQSNQVIRRIGADGVVKTVAGSCPASEGFGCPEGRGYSGDGGPATLAQLNNNVGQGTSPHGKITFDSAGNLYIADSANNVVRKVIPGSDGVLGDGDPMEEIITTVAGTGEAGYSGDDGLANEAQLSGPMDVAVDADGTLFIADTGNACVRKVEADGVITTAAGKCGSAGFTGDGGLATRAKLRSPYGVSIDAQGGLYIADGLNNRIRKVVLR